MQQKPQEQQNQTDYDTQMATRFIMSLFSLLYQLEIFLSFKVGISYAYALTKLLYVPEINRTFVLDNNKEKGIHFFRMNAKKLIRHNN